MNDVTEEVTPALFDHAKRLYDSMLERSHKEQMQYEHDGESMISKPLDVYEGHLTRLFAELGLPNPYYTKIKDVLVGQNCMEQIRRGGGVALSKWVLHQPPTEEGFRAVTERNKPNKGKQAILEQRVGDLARLSSDLFERIEELQVNFDKLHAKVMEVTGK